MREQANKIKDKYFQNSNVNFLSGINAVPDKNKKRVLVFTNSFNEMSESIALNYIKKLDADYVLFIEPGTKEVFHSLLGIRNKLISKKYNILYPCSQNSLCPLEDKDDWCHQYLKLDLDHDIKRLSQLVKINRKWQAACIHLYSVDDSNKEDQKIILRTFSKTKFSKDWQLCESNSIKEFKNFKKDYSKDDYKELDEFLAGDIVSYDPIKILKSGEIRGTVKL
jgi:ribosomal protein RSM22 (predicted rRNA methylase)